MSHHIQEWAEYSLYSSYTYYIQHTLIQQKITWPTTACGDSYINNSTTTKRPQNQVSFYILTNVSFQEIFHHILKLDWWPFFQHVKTKWAQYVYVFKRAYPTKRDIRKAGINFFHSSRNYKVSNNP